MRLKAKMKRGVHQIPFEDLFSVFPELKWTWIPLHQKWRQLCRDTSWSESFHDHQDAKQRLLFSETKQVPDMECYQKMERLGQEDMEAKPLGDGWYLNRGKISYPRLAWMSSFEQRGIFWYPDGGYREWHSNYPYNDQTDRAGWRIYLVDVVEEGKSGFQYLDTDGQLAHCPDRKGYANVFWLPHDRFFWHAVYSHTNRFSCGFHPMPHVSRHVTEVVRASVSSSLEDS
jgi:hypothetical protein